MKKVLIILIGMPIILGIFIVINIIFQQINENKVLNEVISRLEAESRIAEVLVTNVRYDEAIQKTFTTIKFLEYSTTGNLLEPRYFTFPGNIIQFQSLVVRFDDFYIKKGDSLKGKSVYLFWKAFMLDGKNTKEYEITKVKETPEGYKLEYTEGTGEERFWERFWDYVLNYEEAKKRGIKNAQIEAPGTIFIPGTIYTLIIEHDGGIRIDAEPVPAILKGENILE